MTVPAPAEPGRVIPTRLRGVEALQVAGIQRELLDCAFVADQHAAAVREHPAEGPQHRRGLGHVVQRLEDRDQVVAAAEVRICCITVMKRDAVRDDASLEQLARTRHRRFVEIDAVDHDLRVAARERLAGVTQSTGHIGDASLGVRLQALVDLRNRRQPPGCEQVLTQRPGGGPLPLMKIGGVARVRYAGAGAKRIQERVQRSRASDHQLRHRR